jgi:hypothetical protein
VGTPSGKRRRGQVIAQRQYDLRAEGRNARKVILRFEKPYVNANGFGWICEYTIDGLEERVTRQAAQGVDAVQALLHALERAAVDLTVSQAFQCGEVSFWGRRSPELLRVQHYLQVTKPAPDLKTSSNVRAARRRR